jgi:hypothetical protein
MAPTSRPIPRFVAEPPHELEPYGRWSETLAERFLTACQAINGHEDLGRPGEIEWYPERTYGGQVYVPATAPTEGGFELFGYVAFRRGGSSGEPDDFVAAADFTEETADRNPGWRLDLNEEVIGRWNGPGNAVGDLTLVWGRPLGVRGAVATAELGGETVDQCALVQSDSFTLVALDAVTGMGDDLYLEIVLWDRSGARVAAESLYEEE